MRVCGIVAEYNPFHNGHSYQIEKIRENGFDGIVAVMSGNFVQRGEAAIVEKRLRVEQALSGGVDLVVELPLPYAVSSAEKFALGGVSVLNSLGTVNSLCFGSECGNIDVLKKIADVNPEGRINIYLTDGRTYASAFECMIENELGSDYANVLKSANNILGIEYIKALNRLGSDIEPITFKRIGAFHDSDTPEGKYCSASYLRENIENENIKAYVPDSTFRSIRFAINNKICPVTLKNNENAVLSFLRRCDEEYFSSLPDISEGIENRLFSDIKEALSLDDLYSLIKTKRYTLARIKRLVLNAYLGVTADYTEVLPPYIRALGFNEKGQEILKNVKKKGTKPILTIASDFSNADEICRKYYSLECRSTDLYSAMSDDIQPCYIEQMRKPVIRK